MHRLRAWDGWMSSPTQWTWVWVKSGTWWWTGRPGVLQSMGSQRVRHDQVTELNWTELNRQALKGKGFPGGSDGKELACNAGDLGLVTGLGRSPGEGNGYPLQCSCLEKEFRGQRGLAGESMGSHTFFLSKRKGISTLNSEEIQLQPTVHTTNL